MLLANSVIFRNQYRIAIFVVGYLSGFIAAALMVESRYWLSEFFMLNAIIYLVVAQQMIRKYFFYVTHHLTEKEHVSRKQACNTY